MARPCAGCRNAGAKFALRNGVLYVLRCSRCGRFVSDLEAARWYFKKPSVVEIDGELAVTVREADRLEGR